MARDTANLFPKAARVGRSLVASRFAEATRQVYAGCALWRTEESPRPPTTFFFDCSCAGQRGHKDLKDAYVDRNEEVSEEEKDHVLLLYSSEFMPTERFEVGSTSTCQHHKPSRPEPPSCHHVASGSHIRSALRCGAWRRSQAGPALDEHRAGARPWAGHLRGHAARQERRWYQMEQANGVYDLARHHVHLMGGCPAWLPCMQSVLYL